MEVDEDHNIFGMKVATKFTAHLDPNQEVATSSRPDPNANPQPAPNGVVGNYFSSNDSISTIGNSVIQINPTVNTSTYGTNNTTPSTNNQMNVLDSHSVISGATNDAMLQKRQKSNLISHLCTICLFKADFNFNFKKIGHDIIHSGAINNLIPNEQYGSRKVKKAILHVVHKKLMYDIVHIQQCPAILCSNDAKTCYD